jgi:hypothetical protein
MKYQTIPVDSIKPDPSQPRKEFSEKFLTQLATSIKSEGVINAIEVDEEMTIITGEQRWRAAKIAGLTEVPIKVVHSLTPDARFIRQVQENIHNNTMSALDTALALDKVKKILFKNGEKPIVRGKTSFEPLPPGVRELHNLFGIHEDMIVQYFDILGIQGELREALKDPLFSRTKIAPLRNTPVKYRPGLEHLIATQKNVTRDTITQIVKGLNRAERYGEDHLGRKLLEQDYTGLNVIQAVQKINRIVPDEEARTKEPAEAMKFISGKVIEVMEFLDTHPLESFDEFHRGFVMKDLNSLGLYLSRYFKGDDMTAPAAKLLGAKKEGRD